MPNIGEFIAQISSTDGFARQNRYHVVIPTGALAQKSNAIYQANAANLEYTDEATDWMGDFYGEDVADEGRTLCLYCEHTEIPGYQFQMEVNRHYGPVFKIPHLPEYNDITMTFLCGSRGYLGMNERYFFDSWMYMIMDPVTNNFNYMRDYALDIDIYSYNERADSVAINFTGVADYLAAAGVQTLLTAAGITNNFAAGTRSNLYSYTVEPNYVTTLVDAFPIAINAQELGYGINDTVQKVQVTFTYKRAVPYSGLGSNSTLGMGRRGRYEALVDTVSVQQ